MGVSVKEGTSEARLSGFILGSSLSCDYGQVTLLFGALVSLP